MPSAFSTLSVRNMSYIRSGARPMLGSSSMMKLHLLMSARPTASICCSPPESDSLRCLRRSARRGKSWNTRSKSRSMGSPPSVRA